MDVELEKISGTWKITGGFLRYPRRPCPLASRHDGSAAAGRVRINLAVPAEMRWALRAKGVIDDWLMSDTAAERPIDQLPAADLQMEIDRAELTLSWLELQAPTAWQAMLRASEIVAEMLPELLRTRTLRIDATLQVPTRICAVRSAADRDAPGALGSELVDEPQQVQRAEGLRQEPVGAGVGRTPARRILDGGGEHDDPRPCHRRLRAHHAAGLDAIHAWHVDVEEDEPRTLAPRDLHRLRTV